MARFGDCAPATLGLAARCREIPLLGSDRRLWDLLRRANQPVAVVWAQGSGVSENADPEEARTFVERGRRLCTYVDALSGP